LSVRASINCAFFADGVQNEILTDLAKIADLKVIRRTSVLPYKKRAIREICAKSRSNLGLLTYWTGVSSVPAVKWE